VDLSDYLERRYAVDRSAVDEIQALTDRALHTLVTIPFGDHGWPYELTNGEPLRPPRELSHSTVAMILHAVAVAYGVISVSVLVPAVRTGTAARPLTTEVSKLLTTRTNSLVDSLGDPEHAGTENCHLTESATWGHDDVLTLTWLYELLGTGLVETKKAASAKHAIEKIATGLVEGLMAHPQSAELTSGRSDKYAIDHPFLMLRCVQLAKAIKYPRWPDISFSELPGAFLAQLHGELSNSAVRDGGFDPACLVFALEGLLLINPDAVSEAVLERVVAVLGSAPSIGSHWRPVRPIDATNQGRILLPQSVEVANSYLRVCDLHSARRGTAEPLFAQSVDTLQSYADWLMSCVFRVRVTSNGDSELFDGWQSEHTFKTNLVHLWATSQVVLFLQHYSAMLQQHAARCSRIAAGLEFSPSLVKSPEDRTETWREKWAQEPLNRLDKKSLLRIYWRIEELFVSPRGNAESQVAAPSYSILLYGPPGTGKTSFCRDLAEALGYDMLSVTPSDFIRSGSAAVEQRAKELFDVLRVQSNTVILLDEIDRLLLDRSSTTYKTQESIFQFMTPSMLTKIKDLRDKEWSVFVIATNYAELIDSAIKRPGRIDEQVLLLPPDLYRRKYITEKLVKKELKRRKEVLGDRATKEPPVLQPDIAEIARKTPLYVFTELKMLVATIARNVWAGESPTNATENALKQYSATINLDSYESRFPVGEDVSRGPWKEFALLVYLKAEVGAHKLEDWDRAVLQKIIDDPELADELDDSRVVLTLNKLLDS
jgi:adenylate kinase family enzyme